MAMDKTTDHPGYQSDIYFLPCFEAVQCLLTMTLFINNGVKQAHVLGSNGV